MPTNHFRQLTETLLTEWTNRTPSPALTDAYMEHDGNRYWWVYGRDGNEITKWECRPFPGCATLVVTTHIELREDLRGRGLGKYFHEMRRRAYKRAGFQGEVCTVRSDSEAQNAIVAGSGQSMGTFPSDFGGTYNVWLLPLAVVQPPVQVPAPTVDTCGHKQPFGAVYCERPLGHPGEHHSGPGVLKWPNETGKVLPSTPTIPLTSTPISHPRKPKSFAYRKPNGQDSTQR